MIVLKLESASTLDTLAAIALENRTPNVEWDTFPPGLRRIPTAFLSVQQHARAIKSPLCTPLPISDEGQDIALPVTA